jgi:methylenetetrahydrofolate dehydrogenase (NADP+)/methenyltetrahydrofolate cyclohydrolase
MSMVMGLIYIINSVIIECTDMITFNGNQLAQTREEQLKEKISSVFGNQKLIIAAVLFTEDAGSQLYTRLKAEAARRVGIEYHSYEFSLSDSTETIQTKINELNNNPDINGIIIQKPWRKTWVNSQTEDIQQSFVISDNPRNAERKEFSLWWNMLTASISETKDVDGLHPKTIDQIKEGTWVENKKVLPATCQAVLTILEEAETRLKDQNFSKGKHLVLGKSDLLGIPLFYELKRQGKDVEILASRELSERMSSGQKLLDAAVVVSATGRKDLVTGDMVSDNVVVVDVGEPRADVEFASVSQKASFITPVPGGVGPMTVISLLENCVQLATFQ